MSGWIESASGNQIKTKTMKSKVSFKQGKMKIAKSIAELDKIVGKIKARQAKLPAETELNIYIIPIEITLSKTC